MPTGRPQSAEGKEAEAKSRLISLLDYIKQISNLGRSDADPGLELKQGRGGGDDGPLLLHEAHLRKLQALKSSDGQPVLWLGGDSADQSGVWLRLRRPDGGASGASVLHKAACQAYATLFSLRQEALREGHGAQLMVGVGLIRGKVDGQPVDHPLVLLPAELELDRDGALVVSMANAAQAALWPFPGLADAAPAVVQINQCASDYGLVGTNQPPSPTDTDRWEALFSRAAHCLSSDGQYFPAPPKKMKGNGFAPHDGPIHVYNTFVLYTRDASAHGDRTVVKDADALIDALRRMPVGQLPAAVGRLAGVYGLPVAPAALQLPAGGGGGGESFAAALRWLLSFGGMAGGSPAAAQAGHNFLFFGLPSNEQQDAVVGTLQRHGCAVLLGPPGTGKSQTIANVICHYLATGRRVLVTSKGEPATEVLRNKLPAGIRELTISLGGGDSGSFRRLEGAVEHLADHVAGQPADKLKADADRLQRRFESIQAQLDAIEAADRSRAEKYFPPTTPDASPLSGLRLHRENLELLGVHRSDCSMVNLADAVVATLLAAVSPAAAAAAASSPRTPRQSTGLPARAFFLEDMAIEPMQVTPMHSHTVCIQCCRGHHGAAKDSAAANPAGTAGRARFGGAP